MTKRYLPFLFAVTLTIGGCGLMNTSSTSPEKKLLTAALQDDFTKEFIPSSKETEEGYYTFESGVGGYTMLFPINAVMDQTYYQYRDQEYEAIFFGEGREEENNGYSVVGHFEDRKITRLIDSNLDLMIGSKKLITTEDFEKYTIRDNDIYFAEYKHNIDDDKNGYNLNFLGYIKSRTSDKAIRLTYSSTCLSKTEECHLDLAQERERAKKIFHSVRFTSP
ncbi:hypothetical protein, partial [Lysinibacillus sp. 54212]|uniref:hypothetical protein n=1 Tax=Lysinibacillus sp. 54212 TaxID=3119829 RepID=UPI002FCBF008